MILTDRFEEIQEASKLFISPSPECADCKALNCLHEDIPFLLDKIARLEMDNIQLNKQHENDMCRLFRQKQINERHDKELDRLEAENEKLREKLDAAIADIEDMLECTTRPDNGEYCIHYVDCGGCKLTECCLPKWRGLDLET